MYQLPDISLYILCVFTIVYKSAFCKNTLICHFSFEIFGTFGNNLYLCKCIIVRDAFFICSIIHSNYHLVRDF